MTIMDAFKSGLAETKSRHLSVRLRVQIFLRWLAIIGQLVAVLAVYFGLGFNLPLIELLAVIALSVVLNLWLVLRYPVSHLLARRQAAAYLAYDLAQLFVLLYLTGGLINPFTLLLLAPVTVSASLLDARTTSALVGFASVLASVLLLTYRPLPWQGPPPDIPALYRFGVWTALLLALGFIPTYVWRISRETRRMSAALTATRSVLAREQYLSALDGLAAAAAHQLGTPLGTIALVSNELKKHKNLPPALREDVALISEQTLRCRDILSSLSSEGDDDPVISHLSLRGLLDEAVLEAGLVDRPVHISCRSHDLPATGEPRVLRRPELIYGLGNIIENAGQFARANVWISARFSAQHVSVEIADDGPGFAPGILAHLGAPYTRSRRRQTNTDTGTGIDADPFGLGLGFFIARTLLQRSGGQVSARNLNNEKPDGEKLDGVPPGGACVRIDWPRAQLETGY